MEGKLGVQAVSGNVQGIQQEIMYVLSFYLFLLVFKGPVQSGFFAPFG
jgi:hypothetical protein